MVYDLVMGTLSPFSLFDRSYIDFSWFPNISTMQIWSLPVFGPKNNIHWDNITTFLSQGGRDMMP